MVDVLIALAPSLIFAFVAYPLTTLAFYLTSVFIMVGAEFVYVGLKNMMPADGQKHSFKERFAYAYKGKFNQNNVLTAAISAIIFVLIMPAGAPIYAVIIGAFGCPRPAVQEKGCSKADDHYSCFHAPEKESSSQENPDKENHDEESFNEERASSYCQFSEERAGSGAQADPGAGTQTKGQ